MVTTRYKQTFSSKLNLCHTLTLPSLRYQSVLLQAHYKGVTTNFSRHIFQTEIIPRLLSDFLHFLWNSDHFRILWLSRFPGFQEKW